MNTGLICYDIYCNMSSSYVRPPSPAGGRRTANTARPSNAPFVNSTSHYDYQAPGRSSREYVSVPRTSNEPLDGGRVLALRQRSPPRRVHADDYESHSRRPAPSLDPVDTTSRRHLNINNSKSPTKTSRPIITRDADRPSSPLSKTGGAQLVEESYIMPASSSSGRHHHRHSSLTAGDKLTARDRERDRLYPVARESTTMRPPPPKVGRDDRDYAYEYTTPKEQVIRDLAPPQRRPRRESYTAARPTSMINLDRNDKLYSRPERDAPPPAYTKGYEGLGRSGSLRPPAPSRNEDITRKESVAKERPRDEREAGYRALGRSHHVPKDDYVVHPSETPRHERPRKPIPEDDRTIPRPHEPASDRRERDEDRARRHRHHRHHRDSEAGKDYEYRDDRDRRGELEVRDRRVRDETREPRDRDGDRDRDTHAGLLAAGGGIAAAGVAAEAARRQRHHEDSSRPSKDETRQIDDKPHERADPEESDREERRRRRRREREKEELRYFGEPREQLLLQAQPEDETQRREAPQPETHGLREQASYDRRPDDEEPSRPRRKHRRHRRSSRTQSDAPFDSSESSESDSSGTRSARPPRVVTPVTDAESNVPKAPPKGILKPPREKFPEEPSSIREGVAPLDAAKKGIPADARWTRINRRLVNPEALEQEGVRFEEFPDHVIVLKVLSQEEIARYTQRTHEIRERRRQGHGSEGSGSGRSGPSEAAGPL